MSGCCDVVLDTEEFANMTVAMPLTSEKPTFRKHLKLFTEEISKIYFLKWIDLVRINNYSCCIVKKTLWKMK